MSDELAPPGMNDYLTGGWPTVEGATATPEQLAEMEAAKEGMELRRHNDAKIFHAAFSKGNGAKALKILRDMTIEQPCFNPEVGENAARMGFTREGQNSIVRYIEQQMQLAEEGPPTVSKARRKPKRGTV